MALKVAELFATLGLDARDIDRSLDRELSDAKRSVAKGMADAARAGGDELVGGLESGASDSVDAVLDVLKRSGTDLERAGQRAGESFADGMDSGVKSVDGVSADKLAGSRSDFEAEGDKLGKAFASGVEQGAGSVSAKVDPGDLSTSRGDFESEGKKLGGALTDGIESGLDGGVASDAVGGFLDTLPAAMTGPAGAAGAAVAGAFIVGMEEGLSSEATQKRLSASLNLSNIDAATVGTTVSNLYADGWDRGRAAEAVEAVYSSLEESQGSQKALEDLSTQALAFSDVFGTDIATGVELARTLISNGLAKDGTEAFDLLSQSMSDTPLYNRDELQEAIREYSQYFAGIGVDGPQAMAILRDAAGKGSYEVDKTGDSVKEFGIIMRDMPDAARSALDGLGLPVEELRAKIAAGGPEAAEAFSQIVSAVQGIEDPLARTQAAVALFGTPFEDVAGNITAVDSTLSSLASGGMADYEGASARNVEATNTMQAKIDSYTNTLKSTLGEAVGGAVYMVGGMFDEEVRSQWDDDWGLLTGIASTGIGGIAADVIGQTANMVGSVINWFSGIPNFVATLPGLVADAATGLWDSITSSASNAAGWVTGTLDGVVGFVAGLPSRIASAASGMWNGIKTAFRNVLVGIANGWNGLSFPSFTIPSVNIPGLGKVGGGKIGGWNLPDITIPEFHTGGIVPGGPGFEMLAVLQGGEQVLTREQQAAINSALTADLSGAMLGPGAGVAAAQAGGSSDANALTSLANEVRKLAAQTKRPDVTLHAPIQTTAGPRETLTELSVAAETGLAALAVS